MTDKQPSGPILPMGVPAMSGIQICRACHGKIRQTAELCEHCGAEKHFGATRRETIALAGVGFLIGTTIAVATRAGLAVGAIAIVMATLVGFMIAHNRHAHRWLVPRR